MKKNKMDERYITMSREPFYEIAKKYIRKDDVVLDAGCGNADFAKYLNRNDIYMLDGNSETVGRLKEEYINVFHSDATSLPFENSFFDVIHTSHLIEHLFPENLYKFMKECDRCLNKDGHLIISAPVMWPHFYDDLSHVKPYNEAVFKRYFLRKNNEESTNSLIGGYEMIESVCRYYLLEDEELCSDTKAGLLFLWVIKKIKEVLNIKMLGKNGFTLVLKKKKA